MYGESECPSGVGRHSSTYRFALVTDELTKGIREVYDVSGRFSFDGGDEAQVLEDKHWTTNGVKIWKKRVENKRSEEAIFGIRVWKWEWSGAQGSNFH